MARPTDSPILVPDEPDVVRARLEQALVRIGSPWFPSLRDLRSWEASQAPLYLVWTPSGDFEIGPRTASLWAACFSPVLRGRITIDAEGRTSMAWRRQLPRFTQAVMVAWAIVLAAWLAVIMSGADQPSALMWWTVIGGASGLGYQLGRVYGGQAIDEAMPWLTEAARGYSSASS